MSNFPDPPKSFHVPMPDTRPPARCPSKVELSVRLIASEARCAALAGLLREARKLVAEDAQFNGVREEQAESQGLLARIDAALKEGEG